MCILRQSARAGPWIREEVQLAQTLTESIYSELTAKPPSMMMTWGITPSFAISDAAAKTTLVCLH
jgi:hypothetical protein